MRKEGRFIGVDGCHNGWIAAIIYNGSLSIKKYEKLSALVTDYPVFDSFLIDMPVGLQESSSDLRPDIDARKMLSPRSSTIFPVPARQAVYSNEEENQKQANKTVLGKSLSKQSIGIIPKIRELDEFLATYIEYKNVICESHPELCFAKLNGSVLMTKKKNIDGFNERKNILSKYLDEEKLGNLYTRAKELKCNPDDIIDAVCLAVSATFKALGTYGTVPAYPQKDARGLQMQIIYPIVK